MKMRSARRAHLEIAAIQGLQGDWMVRPFPRNKSSKPAERAAVNSPG
jgi:hypothetical protein